MSVAPIEAVGKRKKLSSAVFEPHAVDLETVKVPFSSNGDLSSAPLSSPTKDFRPQPTPPSRVSKTSVSGSLCSLVDFVNKLESLKLELQEDKKSEIRRLSEVVKSSRHELDQAERASLKEQEKAKFSHLLKELAIFMTSSLTLLYGRSSTEDTSNERIFKKTLIGLSTASLVGHTADKMGWIEDERVKNALTGLHFLSIGAAAYYNFASGVQLSSSLEKIAQLSSGIVSGALSIDEGHRNRRSAQYTKEAFEHKQSIKENEEHIKNALNLNLITEKRLRIEEAVARILNDYNTMVSQIQNDYRG